MIFQVVGATTEQLNHLQPGDMLHDFVGPLGRATRTEGLQSAAAWWAAALAAPSRTP